MLKKVGQAIAVLYVLSAMVMSNRYVKQEEGKPYSTLLWYVPYLKGMFWPVVEYGLRPKAPVVQTPKALNTSGETKERTAVLKFIEINNTLHTAQDVMAPWKDTRIRDIPPSVWEQISIYSTHMIETGKGLDTEALNRVYPDLGTYFYEYCYKSLTLTKQAASKLDAQGMQEAKRLEMVWIDWYNPKIIEIAESLKKALN